MIFSDSRGFLWIGTSDGLNRYDGYSFLTFRHKPHDNQSISNNFIRSVDEDSKACLWIGTGSGLNKYNPHTAKFENYNDLLVDSLGLENNIKSVYCDSEDNIWVLIDGFLLQLNPLSDQIKTYDYSPDYGKRRSVIATTQIIEDRNGLLWFGTDKGLFSFNRSGKEIINYTHKEGDNYSLNSNSIRSVYEDKKGELWVGTLKGLNKFDRLNKSFKNYYKQESSDKDINTCEINSICEDRNGKLWLAGKNGLILLDKRTEGLLSYNEFLLNNSRIKISNITTVFCDKTNILWAGGLEGLIKLDLKPRKFELYNSYDGSQPRLSGANISAVIKEKSGILWIGYWESGIDKIDLRNGEVTHISLEDKPGKNKIRCLYQDSKDRIWIGTADGLSIMHPGEEKLKSFNNSISEVFGDDLKNRKLYSILEDIEGNMWIGTDRGLYGLNTKTSMLSSFSRIYNEEEEINIATIHAITLDADNNLWLGSGNGLIYLNVKKNVFERIKLAGNYEWLNRTPIYTLLFSNMGELWIGTSYGLSVYSPEKNNFRHYSEKDGLANSFVYAIEEDIEGNIWVSTNHGLSKFNPLTGKFRNFTRNEGLQAYEFNKGASYASMDGELFFGGVSGLNSFYPDQIYDNPTSPEIAITKFQAISSSGIFDTPVGKFTNHVRIQHNQSFTISFSALDFTHPANNHYRYSLEELGKPVNWLELGDQHSLIISNLASGEYIFRVKGSNNDGVWSKEGTSLRILVEAPFWKTRIAYGVYFILLLLMFYLIIQFRTNALRKTNRVLREKENTAREVAKQKELLSRRNKNIEDSLNYAHRIQSAMLNTPRLFKKHLPHSFILHKPKDIVSGDFYWISEMDNKVFVAAVDCTGHGVPGAFMSVIGFELFRKIVIMQEISDPGEILNALNNNFEDIFGIENDISLRDGMDLAFCILDKEKMLLEYAGAFNPLYIVRDNKLIEFKGDRMSIGADNDPLNKTKKDKKFSRHTIQLRNTDMIYLFSDGYADQFGGPEGKKFKYRRFRHLLLTIHQLPLEKQKQFLDESIEEWRGEIDQIDDILVIGIKADFKP
ncbi:MAG: ligand-binding sensor domain-containing protein [Bacteroidota bacterium]